MTARRAPGSSQSAGPVEESSQVRPVRSTATALMRRPSVPGIGVSIAGVPPGSRGARAPEPGASSHAAPSSLPRRSLPSGARCTAQTTEPCVANAGASARSRPSPRRRASVGPTIQSVRSRSRNTVRTQGNGRPSAGPSTVVASPATRSAPRPVGNQSAPSWSRNATPFAASAPGRSRERSSKRPEAAERTARTLPAPAQSRPCRSSARMRAPSAGTAGPGSRSRTVPSGENPRMIPGPAA
ncbi:MAG: hypothetical protein QM704_27750 [Anaeromyxobacteraceae bacterium]